MSRPTQHVRDRPDETDLRAVLAPIRRVVSARMAAPADVDDVVQETAARLWAVRWRLERGALLGYGVAVARNLVTSVHRGQELSSRHAARLAEARSAGDPSDGVLRAEEYAALRAALAGLRAEDRALLTEHELGGRPLAELADRHGVGAGAVAARLARARARLRVQFLLEYRRVRLPTPQCRGVLDALSLGDRSRQRALDAGGHLLGCRTCAELADPLVRRDRSLAALAPVALLALPGRAWEWARGNPLAAGTATAGATAVAVAVAVSGGAPPPPAAARPPAPPATSRAVGQPATLSAGGARLLPSSRVGPLGPYAGRTVTAAGVPVAAVPADEGFWVGAGPGRRVWVQLTGPGESRVSVRPGLRASFTGRLVSGPMPAGVPAEARAAGGYVAVDPATVRLGPG